MCPGVLQTSSVLSADLHEISLVDHPVDLAAGHRNVNVLGVDPGVGEDLVALFDGADALGVRDHLALENLAGPGEALGVIDVGMGRDDHLAGGEAEVHLPDQLEHVGQLVEEADVDQGVLRAAVDQVDVHPHPALRLVVHLDHAREDVTPLDHSPGSSRGRMCRGRQDGSILRAAASRLNEVVGARKRGPSFVVGWKPESGSEYPRVPQIPTSVLNFAMASDQRAVSRGS